MIHSLMVADKLTFRMMIYPFNEKQWLISMCERLISKEIECFSVPMQEYDFVVRYFCSRHINFYDSLDTPEDVIFELA